MEKVGMTMHETARERRKGRPQFSDNVIDMLEISSEMAALCRHGIIIDVNAAGSRLFGAAADDELIGTPFVSHVAVDYSTIIAEMLKLTMVEIAPVPVQLRRTDGVLVDAALRIHPARELGDGFVLVTARDISHEGRLAKAARDSEWRFRQLVENGMHLICQCRGDRIAYINPAGARMLGADSPAELCGLPVVDMFHGQYREVFTEDMAALLAERDIIPVCVARRDGGTLAVQIRVTPLPGPKGQREYMIEARDITAHNGAVAALRHMNETLERQVAERTAELKHLAVTDALTGIANRRHFMDIAAVEVERVRRHHHPLAMMMLDIDHFKRVNDTWGHPVGDEVIKATAAACSRAVRAVDVAGRLGGEEFAIILPDTDLQAALAAAERLRQDVAAIRIPVGADTVAFTASIGVAECTVADATATMLLSRADQALYEAKHSGRDRVMW